MLSSSPIFIIGLVGRVGFPFFHRNQIKTWGERRAFRCRAFVIGRFRLVPHEVDAPRTTQRVPQSHVDSGYLYLPLFFKETALQIVKTTLGSRGMWTTFHVSIDVLAIANGFFAGADLSSNLTWL